MEEEFVPYEQALALKELGFDEECLGTYYEEDKTFYLNGVLYSNSYFTKAQELISEHPQITTPLYQQAFRWFMDKHGYYGEVIQTTDKYNVCRDEYQYGICKTGEKPFYYDTYNNPEEAELACLRKLIEIVKQR